ncbi:MAG: helix-turn-helix domain-containing protein [Chloroflexota bacterium]
MARLSKSPIVEILKESQPVEVGRRLRAVRMSRGLSIRALAEQSNLNVNTLSLIENGRTSPSVSTLQVIAQTLQVPITTFFEEDSTSQSVIHRRAGESSHVKFSHGTIENLGSNVPRFGAEPLIITLDPLAGSGKVPIVHTGSEFVYCLEGNITYQVDEKSYLLKPGDSLIFEAHLPHFWHNKDNSPSRMLLVLCPLDGRDQPAERHFGR